MKDDKLRMSARPVVSTKNTIVGVSVKTPGKQRDDYEERSKFRHASRSFQVAGALWALDIMDAMEQGCTSTEEIAKASGSPEVRTDVLLKQMLRTDLAKQEDGKWVLTDMGLWLYNTALDLEEKYGYGAGGVEACKKG